ncbi:MAG: aldo/keto reductase [Cycloclasticus sp.]|jgi:aryl-alcohol dehydrogenase-like predicted oxidoreductase|nr:aldo/keto reductase [Cycloclasticus sp.]MEE4291421.1 aldo/keto reductase [Cycloclasticus sp.]
MKYRYIGNTSLEVSEIGLGGNTFGPPRLDKEQSIACIRQAQNLGVNFIDTANIYGAGQSESYIGEAIAGQREKWIIGTKFNFWNAEGNESVDSQIQRQCDDSLGKLKTDYIDLYQLHAPDLNIPMEAVLESLQTLVKQGKVREVGVCNMSSWRHAQSNCLAQMNGLPKLVSIQNHYNLLRRHVEQETLPYCEASNIGFIPYFPLAGGFLTDKYNKGESAPEGTRGAAGSPIVRHSRSVVNEDIQHQLKTWTHAHGHTLNELAIAWLLSHSEVCSVTTGVSSPEQVKANVQASEWKLDDEQVKEVNKMARWDGTDDAIELLQDFSKEVRFAK